MFPIISISCYQSNLFIMKSSDVEVVRGDFLAIRVFDVHCKIVLPSHFPNCSPLTPGTGMVWAVDIDTLESVLDTIAFGDIQGEDTRNFTEANFVKIFRLAQLMVTHH